MKTYLKNLKEQSFKFWSICSSVEFKRLIDYAISLEKQNKILIDQQKFSVNLKSLELDASEEYPDLEIESVPYYLDLYCPECGDKHVDVGEWASREHKTHQCQSCLHEWKPFLVPSFGIK